jgi:hypothetical protein
MHFEPIAFEGKQASKTLSFTTQKEIMKGNVLIKKHLKA